MSIWTYKVISSGKGGFATPALLESFLNQLGSEGWEIIHFQSPPDNSLAFTGLARRSTQRDWTLEDAAAAAAKAEVDKLRAEFEAKFKGATAPAAEESPESAAAEKAEADGGLRRLRNTERDLDTDGPEEAAEPDEWETLAKEDEIPTFFDAIQPLMRRNQRGEGLSVGVDHLAKKWSMPESEIVGALKECGFTVPDDEDARPAYVEYDGDLYWVNVNRRGELWINTREKVRAPFRAVAGKPAPVAEAEPSPAAPEGGAPAHPQSVPAASPALLPSGPALLEAVRPKMRRNRNGQGGSGSISFLSRALKSGDAELMAAFGTLGLILPSSPDEKPPVVRIGEEEWWLNKDQRGGIWINGEVRQRKAEHAKTEGVASESAGPDQAEAAPQAGQATPKEGGNPAFAAVRLLLKPTRTGALAAKVDRLAESLGKGADELLATLTGLGLQVPEKPRDKPVFVEDSGEIFWINRNAKGELWLNLKASKFAVGEDAPDLKREGKKRKPKSES